MDISAVQTVLGSRSISSHCKAFHVYLKGAFIAQGHCKNCTEHKNNKSHKQTNKTFKAVRGPCVMPGPSAADYETPRSSKRQKHSGSQSRDEGKTLSCTKSRLQCVWSHLLLIVRWSILPRRLVSTQLIGLLVTSMTKSRTDRHKNQNKATPDRAGLCSVHINLINSNNHCCNVCSRVLGRKGGWGGAYVLGAAGEETGDVKLRGLCGV